MIKRREFKVKKFILKLLQGIFLVNLLKVFFDTNIFKVKKVQLKTDKLSKGVTLDILQISDVHNKKSKWTHQRIIKKVKQLNPTIIVLTGDLIDRRTKDYSSVLSFVDALIATNVPLYFVTGNHEWDNPGRSVFFKELHKRHINILANASTTLKIDNQVVELVGIEDISMEQENLEKAFSKVNANNYTILLAHSPYVIIKYPQLRADLIISGHTHGGQIRFPFIGAVVAPGEGLLPIYDKGLFEWKRGQKIYIDSGLGTSHIPVRFLNQSQISFIQINGTCKN